MKVLAIIALSYAACVQTHGDEPKELTIGDEVLVPVHPSCTLEVIRISAPIDSELESEEPIYHREVELRLKNNSKEAIKLAGYGSDENPLILDRFQVWDSLAKRWPPLKVRGVCGTGLRSFTLQPKSELRFTVTIEAKPSGPKFRFGVITRSEKHPYGIVYTKAVKLPRSEQAGARQPTTAVDSKSEGKEKAKPDSEERSQ